MSTIEVMRKALEALENSVDLVQAEYTDNWRHGRPTRAAQLDGLKRLAEDHASAITALRAEIERMEAVEPVAWGVTYHASGEPTDLFFYEDEASIEAENCGWTARVVPLYTAPIAPSIPALTDEDVRTELTRQYDEGGGAHFLKLADWAYALAAERAGARIVKADPLQELADDAKQIGLEC